MLMRNIIRNLPAGAPWNKHPQSQEHSDVTRPYARHPQPALRPTFVPGKTKLKLLSGDVAWDNVAVFYSFRL